MKGRRCLACGQALPSWVRIDKATCTGACRTRLCRQRKDARNTFVTPSGPVAPRSGEEWSLGPVGTSDALPGALNCAAQLTLWVIGPVRP